MDYFDEKLGSLCFSWLNDPVYSIREAATANLKKLSVIFGSGWTEKTLMPRILTLRGSQNYLYRLTALFSIRV
jgi:serine/threonine-protein phosphatase 2A regulatory subunit A